MDIYDKRPVKKNKSYDVIVVGGGIGGISAAVAASRKGKRVLLIEKNIQLGGLATLGLISWYEPLCDGCGKQMIYGIGEELIRLSVKYGLDDLPDSWQNGTHKKTEPEDRFATHFSPTVFAVILDEYLKDNGVDITFDTLVTAPVMDGNLCTGVLTESRSGKEFFPAKAVIDASGDAVLCQRAGVPTVAGTNYMTYWVHGTDIEDAERYVQYRRGTALRKWWLEGSDMNGNGHPAGMKTYCGDTREEITEFVLTGRKMIFDKIKNQNKEEREILTLPGMPQFRTVRHIVGDYVFDGSEEGKTFYDSIGECGDFRSRGRHFQLPQRILYNGKFPNIFACGRIVSATGDGWEITRVIPVCALTGEAAGNLASFV